MPTINRFNQFTKRDYNMDWYAPEVFVPNLEMWDSLLSAKQQKYDAAIAATQKFPKHLENRADLAGQYKQSTSGAIDDITNSYIQNGVSAGDRKMRDFALKLNKDWQPGGLAYELEQEYTDYQNAVAQIDKYYKDNKAENSVNRRFSLNQLKKASEGEFKYDKTGDIYTRSNLTPDIRPYVDIMEEAQKVVKDIKENGYTDIVKMSPAWFKKIEVEEVTPETIKEVTSALMQQPKYSAQRDLELWGEKQNYTPEQLQQLKTDYVDNVDSAFNDRLSKIEKLKTTKDGRKSLQETLAEEGYYDDKIDGVFGPKSKKALNDYIKDQQNAINQKTKGITPDDILNQKILDNYTKPLVAAYSRRKEKEDLIFNQEWATRMKISAQRENTGALITAFQKLKEPPTGDYLTTPGLSRPMETLDKLKTQYNKTYEDSKAAFGTISEASGITDIIGTKAPNAIHAVTEARLRSATPEEFQTNLMNAGIVADAGKLWDYYNSPGADQLKDSYLSMQQARQDLEGTQQAQADLFNNYFSSSDGKKELQRIKKQYNLQNVDDKTVTNMILNDDPKLRSEKTGYSAVGSMAGSSFTDMSSAFTGTTSTNNVAADIRNKINDKMKTNPEMFPKSLRGWAFNAISGAGSDLEKVITDDLETGYTLGYNSDTQSGINFTKIVPNGTGGKVDIEDVDLKNQKVRFNVDARGVTYYITAKTKDGKHEVSAVATAPESHKNRLIQVALDMKKQSLETGDTQQSAVAEQLYSTLTDGPQYNFAVQDALVLTSKSTKQLDNVIDPAASTKDAVRTFGHNKNVRGTAIGGEIESNGRIYQKFKVMNPNTGSVSYMLTYKTNKGYRPVENESGGYWYKNSAEAHSPIINAEMIRRIPVEIDQKKIYNTNIDEDGAKLLMLGTINNDDN